jgi:hypothetical protein
MKEINYDALIDRSLRNVVYLAMKFVEDNGLPGDSHFYITFRTDHPGVTLAHDLKVQYPETMTIVLQNQFSNLEVRYDNFSVDLSFGGVPQTLVIPYDAITYFADPAEKFGLSFIPHEEDEFIDQLMEASGERMLAEQNRMESKKEAEVISFDKYRRK